MTPLAEKLGLTINSNYLRDDLKPLIAEIMGNPAYEGKLVLICWEHTVIPTMVDDFGWTSAPQSWSGKVFDRAWILDFNGDSVFSFQDVPEHVLPGDSAD